MEAVPTSETSPDRENAELTQAKKRLEDIAGILKAWHHERDFDSVRVQKRRKGQYVRACEDLEGFLGDAYRLGCEVLLTIGPAPIRSKQISKGAYDSHSVRCAGELEPGNTVRLPHTQSLTHLGRGYHDRSRSVYAGDYVTMLEVADVAEVLDKGGSIELVGMKETA